MRSQLEPFLKDGKELILVMHSGGSLVGSNAIQGMSVEARKKEGIEGGIQKLVYLAGALFPEGTMHLNLSFCYREVRNILFRVVQSIILALVLCESAMLRRAILPLMILILKEGNDFVFWLFPKILTFISLHLCVFKF